MRVRLIRPKGLVEYGRALWLQEQLAADCRDDGVDSVVLLQHCPVYTAGRRSAGFARRTTPLPAPVFDVSARQEVSTMAADV